MRKKSAIKNQRYFLYLIILILLIPIFAFSIIINLDDFSPRFKFAAGKLFDIILPYFRNEDTIYAPDYSEKQFISLKVNMDKEVALKKIGEPLETQQLDNGELWFYYSRHGPKYDNYYVRIIVFKSDKVIEIIKEFYLD
jgi:hypothetical protein